MASGDVQSALRQAVRADKAWHRAVDVERRAAEARAAAVAAALEAGASLAEVAGVLGVSRSSVARLVVPGTARRRAGRPKIRA